MTSPGASPEQSPPDAKSILQGISIERHHSSHPGLNRYFIWTYFLASLVFVGSAALFWIYGVTFWILAEAVLRASHGGRGHSLSVSLFNHFFNQPGSSGITDGWPVDVAVTLALFATAGSIYLFMDHLMLRNNMRLKRQIGASNASSDTSFFVEFRTTNRHTGIEPDSGIEPDLGYLFIDGNNLIFTGTETRVTVPRTALRQDGIAYRGTFAGLSGGMVLLSLNESQGKLQITGRDTATRLSDTVRDSKKLASTLKLWLMEQQ